MKRRFIAFAFVGSIGLAGCILGPKQDDPVPSGAADDGGFTSDAVADDSGAFRVDSSAGADTLVTPLADAATDGGGADSRSIDGSSDASPDGAPPDAADAPDAGDAADAGDAPDASDAGDAPEVLDAVDASDALGDG